MRSQNRYLCLVVITLSLTFLYYNSPSLRTLESIEQNPSQSDKEEHDSADFERISSLDQLRASSIKDGYIPKLEKIRDKHLLEYINFPARVEPYDFQKCRMSNCFDFSRCQQFGPIKVHIKARTTSPNVNSTFYERILQVIRGSPHYEPDEAKACLFVPGDDTLDRDPLSINFLPNLSSMFGPDSRYGLNYLVFNLYSGSWPDYAENDFAGLQIGAAILAKASASLTYHRPGFDIALPLFSQTHPIRDEIKNKTIDQDHNRTFENRQFLISFKGKRYVTGRGSETRNSLYHIHNDRDVVMLSTCRHGRKWQGSTDSRCPLDDSNYDRYDFVDLMEKSSFCLTPRGRRLGSFRFIEALYHGCVPVVLSNGWVMPFNEVTDWSHSTLQFDERYLLQVPDMLRDLNKSTTNALRKNGHDIYERSLSSIEKIVLSTIAIIERRVRRQLHLGS